MAADTTPAPEAASCTCTPGMCSRGDFRDHQGESPGCMSCADLDPDQPCYAGPTRGDPVAARLGYLRATLDAAIMQPEAFDLPVLLGDWGRALDALDELLTLAGGWIGNAPDVPLIDRETAGLAVQGAIRAALCGKDGTEGANAIGSQGAIGSRMRGSSTDPTPDCGGPRKPPGATEMWFCAAHREFHAPPGGEGTNV